MCESTIRERIFPSYRLRAPTHVVEQAGERAVALGKEGLHSLEVCKVSGVEVTYIEGDAEELLTIEHLGVCIWQYLHRVARQHPPTALGARVQAIT